MRYVSKIISAFPGTGKTYACEKLGDIAHDSDSSTFSKDPTFPANYIKHIKDLIIDGNYEYIFVSSHKLVRDALFENYMPYTLFIPNSDKATMDAYIKRIYDRPDNLVPEGLIAKMWDEWQECLRKQKGCSIMDMGPNDYLYLAGIDLIPTTPVCVACHWWRPYVDGDGPCYAGSGECHIAAPTGREWPMAAPWSTCGQWTERK